VRAVACASVVVAACTGDDAPPTQTGSTTSATTASPATSPTTPSGFTTPASVTPPVTISTPPPEVPAWLDEVGSTSGRPPALDRLIPSGSFGVQRIIVPPGAGIPIQVAASWDARERPVDLGPGAPPAATGTTVWQRFEDPLRWLPVAWSTDGPEAGVLGVSLRAGDATRDGHDDVLVFSATGGSGGCGIVRVLAPDGSPETGAAAGVVFERRVCDATVSVVPRGLELREAVYRPGDAHCCPSATRTSVLGYRGDGRWVVVSERTDPIG
jgi:hypothetical protein